MLGQHLGIKTEFLWGAQFLLSAVKQRLLKYCALVETSVIRPSQPVKATQVVWPTDLPWERLFLNITHSLLQLHSEEHLAVRRERLRNITIRWHWGTLRKTQISLWAAQISRDAAQGCWLVDAVISFSKQAVAEGWFTACVHTGQNALQSPPSAPAAHGALAFWFLGSCTSKPSRISRKSFKFALRIEVIDKKSKFWLVRGSVWLEDAQRLLQGAGAASPWYAPAAAPTRPPAPSP